MMYAAGGIAGVATIAMLVASHGTFSAIVPGYTVVHRLLTRRHDLGRAQKKIREIAKRDLRAGIRNDEKVFVRVIPSSEEPYWMLSFSLEMRHHNYRGAEAVHLAHLVAPALNVSGATVGSVKEAVQEIEDAGSPERYFLRARDFGSKPGYRYSDIRGFPTHLRLAFEMAAHEESERAAMEGELAQLEADWREAEEIASIADNMFIPSAITDFVERHRKKS
jgi:hypothetical protein